MCCVACLLAAGACTGALVANDDVFDISEGQSAVFDPLANDIIPAGNTAVVSAVGSPTCGTAQIADGGQRILYTSAATSCSSDAFTVTILDSSGTTATSMAYASITKDALGSFTWVTPPEDDAGGRPCDKACEALGKEQGWRHVNGGSNDRALCAGLIDMPGIGEQWLPGAQCCSPHKKVALMPAAIAMFCTM
jgi:hypothetical protein